MLDQGFPIAILAGDKCSTYLLVWLIHFQTGFFPNADSVACAVMIINFKNPSDICQNLTRSDWPWGTRGVGERCFTKERMVLNSWQTRLHDNFQTFFIPSVLDLCDQFLVWGDFSCIFNGM